MSVKDTLNVDHPPKYFGRSGEVLGGALLQPNNPHVFFCL